MCFSLRHKKALSGARARRKALESMQKADSD